MTAHYSLDEMMKMDLDENGLSQEAIFELEDDTEAEAFQGERCGICMDIIIDRGVLDCCQHWFCFACIDNWASVTNLCPLCQNEFQLITCVPVYDTIGSNNIEEGSLSRDDDWCIQGNSNTLSFPSYYIDENAIICLDGDGCKIRNGPAKFVEDSNLDTSIACDSCDLWYHAFCVGFDPEATSESSWLCPRCLTDEVPQKSDVLPIQRPNDQSASEIDRLECLIEDSFSGKMSVAVADPGETAVVVSIVEGQRTQELSENFLSVLEVDKDQHSNISIPNSGANCSGLETELKERTDLQSDIQPPETSLGLSLSQDAPFDLRCSSLVLGKLKTKFVDKAICNENGSDGRRISPGKLFEQACIENGQSENVSSMGLHLCLSVGSFLSVDHPNSGASECEMVEDVQPINPSEESSLSVDKINTDTNEDVVGSTRMKRKFTSSRDDFQADDHTEVEAGASIDHIETKVPSKKARAQEKSKSISVKSQVNVSVSDDIQRCPNLSELSDDDMSRENPEKEAVTTDIMSIVCGTDHIPSEGPGFSKHTDRPSKGRDNASGLRVKKIMRRASEEKESSMIIQKLRKEIREAARNKSSKDFSQNHFDPKLLSAFRAVVAGPQTEPVEKLNPMVLRAKKSMLQKGKTRENLTKKIYGTANGRRRRAWDRDWEIEFWKHRSMRTTKPEKVKTLMSVLDLLKKSSETAETEQGFEEEVRNPILSRLYLADTSVFPRKEDIQPLSAIKSIDNQEQTKVSNPLCDNHTKEAPLQTAKGSPQSGVTPFDTKGNKVNASALKAEAASRKLHPKGPGEGRSSVSSLNGSKASAKMKKVMADKSDDGKIDKRKWALEVLARKTATVGGKTTQGKLEENAVLKGNYPLLSQLPTNMKPVLAPSCHNKVPIPVRQAQLYRLAEHFLRRANLTVIRRTADTELAIADAVNIEKEVADRSSSKLVYVNLCSQVLSQHTNDRMSARDTESNSSLPSSVPTESTKQENGEPHSDPTAAEALRAAGLLSDSPPSSPYERKDLHDVDDPSVKLRDEEESEIMFDADFHPELDIYGDFEYDLEDEDYFGASALNISKLQQEGESKVKVVFSTLSSEKSNTALDSEVHKGSGTIELPKNSLAVLECHKDGDLGSFIVDANTDTTTLEPLQAEGCEEPSLAECEELYGPDKEPLIKRFPGKELREPDKLIGEEAPADKPTPRKSKSSGSNKEAGMPVGGTESCASVFVADRFHRDHDSSAAENSPKHCLEGENQREAKCNNNKQADISNPISEKVEAYIKEHIRPLCKSGVITVEQYRYAVRKTTEKVMKHHYKAKNANFLIKEGEKVKKLAEQYIEAAKQTEK